MAVNVTAIGHSRLTWSVRTNELLQIIHTASKEYFKSLSRQQNNGTRVLASAPKASLLPQFLTNLAARSLALLTSDLIVDTPVRVRRTKKSK